MKKAGGSFLRNNMLFDPPDSRVDRRRRFFCVTICFLDLPDLSGDRRRQLLRGLYLIRPAGSLFYSTLLRDSIMSIFRREKKDRPLTMREKSTVRTMPAT